MSDDLVTWLRARLDDDERDALAASPGPWSPNAEEDEVIAVDGIRVADGFALSGRQLCATTRHIARHDPARVLAEVDAKRRIMAIHHPKKFEGMGGLPQICDGCGYGGICDDPITEDINDCPILHALALPYADRPGYRDEWKP